MQQQITLFGKAMSFGHLWIKDDILPMKSVLFSQKDQHVIKSQLKRLYFTAYIMHLQDNGKQTDNTLKIVRSKCRI